MIKSMTGYGKATREINNKKFTVEVRSLNSKQLDLNVRIPGLYREKELQLRNAVSKKLQRGKVDLMLFFEQLAEDTNHKINQSLIATYYKDLKAINESLAKEDRSTDFMSLLMRMPDVMKSERAELDEDEWKEILTLIDEAIEAFNDFRNQEGASLEADLNGCLDEIMRLLHAVDPFEEARIERLKERLYNNLKEVTIEVDNNRFEQEMIYYLEKLDVHEEKVRLTNHCKYFTETMTGEAGQGKKLGFIAQEIGREINTLGSKANHADIQKIVVDMKDQLERIKEQVLNVM